MTWSELVAPESQSMKSMENYRIIRLSRRITVSRYHFLKLLVDLVVAQTNHIIHQMVSVLHMASLVFLEIHSKSAEQQSRREKRRKFIELFTKVLRCSFFYIILPNISNHSTFHILEDRIGTPSMGSRCSSVETSSRFTLIC